MIAKNSIHEVTVTDLNNLGHGIARIDGMVVFVAGGLFLTIAIYLIAAILLIHGIAQLYALSNFI